MIQSTPKEIVRPRREPRALALYASAAVAIVAIAVCGAAGLLFWQPDRFLFGRWLGLSRDDMRWFNFLSGPYPHLPEYAWVLSWIIAAGALLAAVSSSRFRLQWDAARGEPLAAPELPGPSSGIALLAFWLMSAVLLALLLANAYLWISLRRNEYIPLFLPLWLVSLAAFTYPCWRLNRADGVRFAFPFSALESLLLLALTAAFAVYCAYDVMSWQYSFGGDELGFWTFAGRLAGGAQVNVFSSLEGIGGYHPVLSSVYQSLFLDVFGPTPFAWHLSSIAAAALTLPVFYLFLRELIGVRAAVAGALLLAGNHYLSAYAHQGLNNVQVLFPTFLGLSLWFWGARRGDWAALYWAGIATGLGFYTFYSSRLTLAFLVLAFVLAPVAVSARTRLRWFAVYAFGFLLTVIPLIASPGDFFGWMWKQSAIGAEQPSQGILAGLLELIGSPSIWTKWEYCWIDPFFSPRPGRMMWGSWVDSWVAAFFLLGFVWAALRWARHRALLWLVLSYLGAVLGIGVLSQYTVPPDTRMLYLVPFYIAFAVLALEVLGGEIAPLAGRAGGHVLVAALVVVSLAANQYRIRVESPQHYQVPPYALVVRVAQTFPPDRHIYFVAPPSYWVEMVKGLGQMYGFADRVDVLRTNELGSALGAVKLPATFVFANLFPETMDDSVALLRQHYPAARYEIVQDGPGGSRLQVIDVKAG